MKSKIEIVRQFRKHKPSSIKGLSLQYQNTVDCQAFYSGDFMSYRDSIQFTDVSGVKKKASVQFNKIKPYVNAVKGFFAQNRRKAKYSARMQGNQMQEMYSNYANSMSDYIRGKAHADQVETQQDGDMLMVGYGATETAMTYGPGYASTDPNGEIIIGRLDPLMVGWDPYAKASNLTDSRWVFYQKDYDLREAVEMFDANEEDFEDVTTDDMADSESGYEWFARGGRYNKIKEANLEWADEKADMVKVYFYQWMEYETFYRAINPVKSLNNPQAQQAAMIRLQEIASEQEEDSIFALNPNADIISFDDKTRKLLDESFGEFIEPYDFKRKVYYTAVLSGEHVFSAFRNVCQQGFTIKFKTGDYDARKKIWTGMVNSMKEPALYYNKALTELMFIIGANSKGGVMYETGSIEDIQSFEAKYAKTDANVEVAEGALTEGRIQPKRQPFAPTGYENVIQIADTALNDSIGLDKAFLGSSGDKDETGILQKRRIKQAISSLATYADNITLYQEEQARLMLDYMRVWAQNNDGTGLFGILGDNGKQEFIQISADKLMGDYDVVIQEAPQTPEEKTEFAMILQAIAAQLMTVGDITTGKAVLAIAIKYTQLEQKDIQTLMQLLMPEDQQIDPAYVQQLEQQLQALMSDVTQADVKEKISKSMLNMASVEEKTQLAIQKSIENRLLQSGSVQTSATI